MTIKLILFIALICASSSNLINNRHRDASFLQDESAELTPQEDIELFIEEFLVLEEPWPYTLVYNVIWNYYNDGKITKEERSYYNDKLDKADDSKMISQNAA